MGFVLIPVGTILLEEVAFGRFSGASCRVMAACGRCSSLLAPLRALARAAGGGVSDGQRGDRGAFEALGPFARSGHRRTVFFTAAGGLVAGELRRRREPLPSVGMHWATNALGVLFGLVAGQLAG